MGRRFLNCLLNTIALQGVSFFFGLAIALISTCGLVNYEPPPAEAPFDYPAPYDVIFFVGLVAGAFLAVRAYFKANSGQS